LCVAIFGRKIDSMVLDYNRYTEFLVSGEEIKLFKEEKNNLSNKSGRTKEARLLNKVLSAFPSSRKRRKIENSIRFISGDTQ
jgi:hypothetical protein